MNVEDGYDGAGSEAYETSGGAKKIHKGTGEGEAGTNVIEAPGVLVRWSQSSFSP